MDPIRQKRVLLAMGNRYIPRVHYGVAQFARTQHWHLTNIFGEAPNIIRDRECDGIIAAFGEEDPLGDAILERHKPTVSVSIAREHLKIPHITGDNEMMGRAAARHFIDRGFKRFVWYAETTEPAAMKRLHVYRAALRENGYDCEQLVQACAFPDNPPRWRKLVVWIQRSLECVELPCAVYAFNDIQAVNLLDACLAAGLRVPDDVAILGTDNHPLICPTAAVPLSSINNDLDELGRRAGQELAALMDGAPSQHKVIEIPHRGITIRQSSDSCAIDDKHIVSALRFMSENLHRSMSVADIVAATGLTRRALERRFQQHLKMSILSQLNRLRMDYACRLLRETDRPIAEVAVNAGFTTPEYFYRCFRAKYKRTPRQYRNAFMLG